MSSSSRSPLSSITTINYLVSRYTEVLNAVYNQQIKDSSKRQQCLDDDEWRYGELPDIIVGKLKGGRKDSRTKTASQKGKTTKKGTQDDDVEEEQDDEGDESHRITLDELGRLVRWKITHGQNRPFLPALIRRNDPDTVRSMTAKAFRQLHDRNFNTVTTSTSKPAPASGSPAATNSTTAKKATAKKSKFNTLPPHLHEPWTTLLTLTGVGPATASLLLSAASPDTVPFFSDELYALIVHGDGHDDGADKDDDSDGVTPAGMLPKLKLKYDVKEYTALLSAFDTLRHDLGKVSATTLEKAAWAYAHLSALPSSRREKIQEDLQMLMRGGTLESLPEQDQNHDQEHEEGDMEVDANGVESDTNKDNEKAVPKRSKAAHRSGKRPRQPSMSEVAVPDAKTDTSQQKKTRRKK